MILALIIIAIVSTILCFGFSVYFFWRLSKGLSLLESSIGRLETLTFSISARLERIEHSLGFDTVPSYKMNSKTTSLKDTAKGV